MNVKVRKFTLKVKAGDWLRNAVAEFVGTFIISFLLGVSAIRLASSSNQEFVPISPFIIGGVVAVGMLAIARYSSAHLNPAISLGVFVRGGITFIQLLAMVIAQFLGGFLGAAAVKLFLFPGAGFVFLSVNQLQDYLTANQISISNIQAALIEAFGALVLTMIVIEVSKQWQNRTYLALVLAGVYLTLNGTFQTYTVGIFNPAFAPLVSAPALYVFAPLLGGVVGALISMGLEAIPNKNEDAKK